MVGEGVSVSVDVCVMVGVKVGRVPVTVGVRVGRVPVIVGVNVGVKVGVGVAVLPTVGV